MTIDPPSETPTSTPLTPGWRTMVVVAVFYVGCLAVATWPAFATFGSTLPSRVDPLTHLWTMRWYKACLFEGRLPFFCPDIQYPVGAALGTLPPMHFQTLLYIPLSMVIHDDALCYNLIRTGAFLLTGLGTFLLIWHVLRSRPAAILGGMTTMISMPMIFFSMGELEQITVGWFPIFMIAWLRWVDRPTGRGLAAVAGTYILVAMSAPYFGVFVIFPAALYVAWRAIGVGRSGILPWLGARAGWLAAFAAITAPVMVVLFLTQIWAMTHGHTMARPDSEFAMCRAPLWSYAVPSPWHQLGKILPFDTNVTTEMGACPSYLGLVTLALVAYAAVGRARFSRASYWWAVLAVLVVLSLGSHAKIGGHDVSMPAAWLKRHFIGFRMIRVPARFNLFAAVVAALIAGAGLRQLLAGLPGWRTRVAAFGLLASLALADLSVVPFSTVGIPPMPACYPAILAKDPAATFLEVPQFNSGGYQLPAVCTYWQTFHGGKTSSGYTAFLNFQYDNRLMWNSPFDAFKLRMPLYLADPRRESFEFAHGVDFRSYVWLYLKVNDFRYVVVHHQPGDFPEFAVHLDRLKAELADSKIHEDAATVVFDRERMPKPTVPVFLYTDGWGNRVFRETRPTCMLGRSGRVMVYNPTPERALTFTLDAAAHKHPRTVLLREGGEDLARWEVPTGATSLLATPPFRLTEGLHELNVVSDGDDRPSRYDAHVDGDFTHFSLWVTGLGLEPALPRAVAGRRTGLGPR